jgi:tellurite resistance protein TerC
LFWGIVGALVFRAAMIVGGVYLVTRFTWLFYIFGAYLIYVGAGLLRKKETSPDAANSLFVRAARRILPLSENTDTTRFTCRQNGRFLFTPLILVLAAVEAADVLFALDSIPAVLAISTDTFIVFTSNVFAILGLRSLFFVLSDMMERFVYLKISLAVILAFIGGKMVLHSVLLIPNLISLVVIAVSLGVGIAASLLRSTNR